MGFGEEWIRKVLMCISSISFSVLINGEPSETFRPQEVSDKEIFCTILYSFYVRKA